MRARELERALLRAGARFVKSESSHKTYQAPSGQRFHLCFHHGGAWIGPLALRAAWAAMADG